jgi:hypothetical protein
MHRWARSLNLPVRGAFGVRERDAHLRPRRLGDAL